MREYVAVLGPEGTFSWFTALELFDSCAAPPAPLPCADLAGVFEAVRTGQAAWGLVPLENSLRGTVAQSFDLFLATSLSIRGECFSRIRNVLLGQGPLAAVRAVYSHPQPLAQCGHWLREQLPGVPLIAMESTAAAARHARDSGNGAAALGHPRLAELTGLRVLAGGESQGLEDGPENWTRFVLVAAPDRAAPAPVFTRQNKAQAPAEDFRSSLLFTLPDKPGALAEVLNVLARGGINMRKLESRPLGGACWKYAFFADVECDLADTAHAPVRDALHACCTRFSLLGSYPKGPHLCSAPSPDSASSEPSTSAAAAGIPCPSGCLGNESGQGQEDA